MRQASLIISHAGAGSVMEALTFRKPLIVCVNESLMGNHQEELAVELHDRKHLILTNPADISDALVVGTSVGRVSCVTATLAGADIDGPPPLRRFRQFRPVSFGPGSGADRRPTTTTVAAMLRLVTGNQ